MRLSIRPKTILLAASVVLASFFASLGIMNWLAPRGAVTAPVLKPLPPLPPVSQNSFVVAPVAISLSAIRDLAERTAQRNFSGKADNPISQILQNAEIGWSAARGPIAATGAQDVLSLSAPLTGKLNVTGSLASKATGALGDALGGLLGGNAARQLGAINIKALNASAEIKGNVTITSRPRLAAAWFVEPNLAAQVSMGDSSLALAGAKVNVPAEIKPVIDKTVGEQVNIAEQRIRSDQTLHRNARAQWAKACRSIPLQATGPTPSTPALWLEVKPTRAIAAQPRVDASNLTLTMGIEAETRITSQQTRPDCPFPDKITIIPPTAGGVGIRLPIDMPFTDLSKIVEAQFAGKTFPEDGSGPVTVTVKHASVAAAGDRLLISLLVHAKEKKSFFGFGADATVHIWGRPVLDQAQQMLRLDDVQLAVESEAAFGLLGTAARAVVPHLQSVLADKARVDLKPFAANAEQKIAAVIADLQKNENGIKVDARIDGLHLVDIAFDSRTLRVIAEADGSIHATVTSLSGL